MVLLWQLMMGGPGTEMEDELNPRVSMHNHMYCISNCNNGC